MSSAAAGAPLSSVETPALVLNLRAHDRNAEAMVASLSSQQVFVRPHAKAHKCAELALRQKQLLGSLFSGVCAQTVLEAEVMSGVGDVLVTNECVTPGKIARVVELAASATAKVSVLCDSAANARALSAAATTAGATIHVLVEADVGQGRCGVDTPEEAVALAREISGLAGLEYAGLHAYHGGLQHVRGAGDRAAESAAMAAKARAVVEALSAAGLAPATVTGGGTGDYLAVAASGLYTEVQPGSFFFGDVDYSSNEWDAGAEEGVPFEQSLFILTTVVSASEKRRVAIVDAGLKALSLDSGPPAVHNRPELSYRSGGDEHGILDVPEGTPVPAVGDVLRLVPGHIDPTMNMHDHIIATEDDVSVHAVWRVAARGAGV